VSPGQRKRLRRIQLRASQPVKDALVRGLISPRRADTLLYLPEIEGQQQLERILSRQKQSALRCKTAVRILREHLEKGSRDLVGLRRDLRRALSQLDACAN
jgi:hypothetical protein